MAELRLGENIVVPAIVIKEGAEINNQDKTITQNGQYTADEGYTGLGTVTVNVSGGEPTGTISITQNGNYDVAQYANANVNVAGGGGGTRVPDFTFENLVGTVDESGELHYRPVDSVFDFSFPGIKRIREDQWQFGYAFGFFALFFKSKNVRNVSFPDLEEIGAQDAFLEMFFDSRHVRNVSFPSLTTCVDGGLDLFLEGAHQSNLITLHFRADAKDMIEALPEYEEKFGATDGDPTILFDL